MADKSASWHLNCERELLSLCLLEQVERVNPTPGQKHHRGRKTRGEAALSWQDLTDCMWLKKPFWGQQPNPHPHPAALHFRARILDTGTDLNQYIRKCRFHNLQTKGNKMGCKQQALHCCFTLEEHLPPASLRQAFGSHFLLAH